MVHMALKQLFGIVVFLKLLQTHLNCAHVTRNHMTLVMTGAGGATVMTSLVLRPGL